MANDYDNNLPIETAGVDAQIGTDVFQNNGTTAHAQIVKIAWGDDETVNRATAGTPLPVQVFGITGSTPVITVTGSVRGLGYFGVTNSASAPLHVTGGVVAHVYGITGATPVAVTGAVNILSGVTITGTVTVTGGRVLNQTIDSVLVGGTVARNWNLTATDVVRVLNSASGSTLPTYIVGAEGNVAGVSGDALKVAIVNTGFSASITFDSVLSVQNVGSSALRVQGTANGTPINVQFATTPSINISNSGTAVEVDAPPANSLRNGSLETLYYGFDRNSQAWQTTNNIEKLLLGAKPETTVYHTVGQWLGYLWKDLAAPDTGTTDSVAKFVKKISDKLTSSISVIPNTNYSSGLSYYIEASSNVVTFVDNGLVGVSSLRNGIMYINNSASSDQQVLFLSQAQLQSLVNDSSAEAFEATWNGAFFSFTWRGNPINPNTVVTTTSGEIKKPYYMGYRLPPNSPTILPFLFFGGIMVTSTTNNSNRINSIPVTIIY
jgi:hypothetical protein